MPQLLGGLGPTIVIVMWIECGLAVACTAARCVSRTIGVNRLGSDDLFTIFTTIFLILFALFLTFSANKGFGQHSDALTHDQFMDAYQSELIGQTFGVCAAATSKVAVGLFQLRIVETPWVRWVIWVLISVISIGCACEAVFDYLQCIPPDHIWNPTIPANCWMSLDQYVAYSKFLAAWAIVCDFMFAIIPWIVIWPLNMPRARRAWICVSMSWGIFAGVCGIVRMLSVDKLSARMDYTYDMVSLVLWSSTETLVTLGTACIPTYRDLFVRIWKPHEMEVETHRLESQGPSINNCCCPQINRSEDPLVFRMKEINSTEPSVVETQSRFEGPRHPRAAPSVSSALYSW